MIKQIHIKNYILIDELLVKFDNALNVITGETGAGKSILINAIDVVFASRVSKDIIKTGSEKASIELILTYNKTDLAKLFEENGIDCFGGEIIISKEISQNGVRSRVNGTLVNQEFIKVLREKFLDIHSQHQTYAFMQPKFHINLLDNYSSESFLELLFEYKIDYSKYQELLTLLSNAKNLSTATENQIDFLKFQLDEIEALNIVDVDEYDNLKNELSVLDNVEKLKELTGSSYWSMSGDDGSILNAIGQIKSNLSKASQMDDSLLDVEENLISATDSLREISSILRDYSQNLENDTGRLNEIQERIFELDKIKRKYGNSLQDVLDNYTKLKTDYEQIEFSTQNIEELEANIKKTLNVLNAKAELISQERKKQAKYLSELIVEKLEKLELPKARFQILVEDCELTPKGKDRVEFLISTNVSEELKPLAKVASGGEVSRVMLAIKSIFAQSDEIDTVIFDEIDTGISGKASQSVADEISELSNYHQIILITHQPIIASKANKHFYVKKAQGEYSTQVEVFELDGENRIKAIAELAGGEINEQSLEFARSLIS